MTTEDIYHKHQARRRQHYKDKLPGLWLLFIFIPFVVAGIMAASLSRLSFTFALGIFFLALPVSLPWILFGVYLARATAQFWSPEPAFLGLEGHVLLLRPFVSDSISAKRNVFLEAFLTQQSYLLKMLLPETNLQRLIGSEVTNRIGPLVTVSNPKEWFRFGGETKIDLEDEGWQEAVAELARTARCIILDLGATRSFQWELRFVRENICLEKVFALIGFEDAMEDHWPELHKAFKEIGYELPLKYPGSGTVLSFQSNGRCQMLVAHAENVGTLVSAIEAYLAGSSSHANKAHMVTTAESGAQPGLGLVPLKVPTTSPVSESEEVERRKWERKLMRNIFSGGLSGCLLVLLSVVAMLFGCYLTFLWFRSFGQKIQGRRWELLFALPSIGLGVGVFYVFSPLLFQRYRRGKKLNQLDGDSSAAPSSKNKSVD